MRCPLRIEQLENLIAITEAGSLRRASERLRLSQPALSDSIASLERELEVSLLDRPRTGAQLSEQGRELLPQVARVLEAVEHLRATARGQSYAGRSIRVGTVNAGTSALLVPAILQFNALRSTTNVDVANILQTEIYERLAQGTIDLGLVNMFPADELPASLEATPLLRGNPGVCCRTDSPLAQKTHVTADELRTYPFVAMRPGYLMHRFTRQFFEGNMPTKTFFTDGAEMGKFLVASGLGATLLPDYSVRGDPLEDAGVLTIRPLTPSTPTVTMSLLVRKGDRIPQAVQEFKQALLETAHSHPQAATSQTL